MRAINYEEADTILQIISLHIGERNAIKDKEIREIVEVRDRDPRKPTAGLREIINGLRRRGQPICSSTNGYWFAENEIDLKENIESLEGRAIKILEATKGMKECLAKWQNPMIQNKLL